VSAGINSLLFFLCILLSQTTLGQVTCTSTGNWSSGAVWAPSAPAAGENVTVALGCTLYVDIATPAINNLIIQGVVIVNNTGSGILSIDGNITVNSGAALVNNGKIIFNTPGNTFTLAGTGSYTHNPLDNIVSDEDIFTNSNESFSTTSNLIIQKWHDGNIPLAGPTRVQNSIFGNVTLSANVAGGTWDQDGFFSVPSLNRIRGSLTVSASTVVMDDGTGSTTSLILQDVTVTGTGNIVFQRGYNRNFSLQVNNFTVSSSAPAKPTVILDTSFGVLNMTVNGSMNLGHDFNAVYGGAFLPGADIRVTVNGNLNITGGEVIFNKNATAPLRVTVNGTCTLNNTSPGGIVCFMNGGGNGAFLFNTQDLIISAGSMNYLFGMPGIIPAVKGTATYNISNDFIVNGSSTTYMAYSDTSISKVRIAIARDFNLNGINSTLTGAYTNGALTFKTGRNFSQTNGKFIGQAYRPNLAIDSVITGGNFTFNSGNASDYFIANRSSGNTFMTTTGNFSVLASGTSYGQGVIGVDSSNSTLSFTVAQNFIQNGGQFSGILSGSGVITFSITGVLDVNGGVCKIHNNTLYSNTGNINFFAGSIDFDGGVFSGFFSCNNSGLMGTFIVGTTCNINFTDTGDEFSFIGVAIVGSDVNNLQLFLNIPGGLTIGGLNGTFFSSIALGAEIITIGGLSISNGTNSFNGQPGAAGMVGHFVTMTINGNVNISGGDSYLSAMSQTINATINGDLIISGGSLSLKGSGTTTSTLNILNAFNQTGGSFYLHNNLTQKMPEGSVITVNINSNDDNNGDFTQTGGSIIYDNCSTTPASMNLVIAVKSPNYTLGGNGQITMTLPGTGPLHGILNFERTGTINFFRSGTHNIQQVKQNVLTACTLDIVNGDMQLSSHNVAPIPPNALWIYTGAVLDLRGNKLYSNASYTYCGVSVFGRLRTTNTNGMYDGTINAAFSTNITDNFDFYIAASSTIEYYGSDTQVITGLGVGKAIATQHKYGILEINFSGTPDVEFVYPTNIPNDSAVMVRTSLLLTNGELNLDNDHDPANGGGRWIVLESGSVTAMQRTNGYIRSESQNGNGLVKWILNSVTGSRTIHFGYNSVEYIPVLFSHSSGSSVILYAATYHTDIFNIPYPPTVTHVRNNAGVDNSDNTVDRFWYLQIRGNLPFANIRFNCTPAETGTITGLVAQRWVELNTGWTLPPPGVQTSFPYGVQANNLTIYNYWWTLSGNSIPLPVELISFSQVCDGDRPSLHWQTASEINNQFFTLEKSSDGNNFELVAIIPGAGTTSEISSYSYTLPAGLRTNNYFRISQTDFDGTSTAGPVIYVRPCSSSEKTQIYLASSQSGKPVAVIYSAERNQLLMQLISVNGSTERTQTIMLDQGENSLTIDLSGLASGIYFLRFSSLYEEFNFKVFNAE